MKQKHPLLHAVLQLHAAEWDTWDTWAMHSMQAADSGYCVLDSWMHACAAWMDSSISIGMLMPNDRIMQECTS